METVILYKTNENAPEKYDLVKNLTNIKESDEKGLNFLWKLGRMKETRDMFLSKLLHLQILGGIKNGSKSSN